MTTHVLALAALARACTFEQSTDYQGNDIPPITALQVANASECCALCAVHDACTAWTLQSGIGCYLKTSAAGKRAMTGATSGSTAGPAPPPAPPSCRDAADCSLGGECVDGACACDATWKGPNCVQLNLAPASPTPLCDNGSDQSWGGNTVYDAADGKWHLFFAEFLNDCPLGSWGTNSIVSHATSSSPQGPYTRRETVLPAFHHNPSVAYDASSGTFVLLAIGAGNASAADIQNCTKAAAGAPLGDPAQAGVITLSHARSANGPWVTLPAPVLPRRNGWERGFFTNPSLFFFENGTALMAYRGGQPAAAAAAAADEGEEGGGWPHFVGIATAPSWAGPYTATSDAPVFPDVQEDPGIFRDARGNFHMLTHDFAQPTGGHAFSADGLKWTFAGNAYGTSMALDDGSSVDFQRRERPQVLVHGGKPVLLFTGALAASTGHCATTVQPIAQEAE